VLASTERPAFAGFDPNLAPAATVMSPIALSRYGSAAGELLAWLPIAAGVTGHWHAAFHGEFLGTTPGQ
jgi:hypothetical protein